MLDAHIHNFFDQNTGIIVKSFQNQNTDTLWVVINDYSKILNFAQTEILRLLLAYLLNEKNIYAT